MTSVYILVFAIIIAVLVAVPVFGGFGKKRKTTSRISGNAMSLDKKFVQNKWSEIEEMFALGGISQLKNGIMEADKLVDYVFKCKGVAGETMGERMKNAKSKFLNYSDYDNLWFAHKVRNNIAHESKHELGTAEAKRALEYFKKALKVLEVL